jgi:hypothetical protein
MKTAAPKVQTSPQRIHEHEKPRQYQGLPAAEFMLLDLDNWKFNLS